MRSLNWKDTGHAMIEYVMVATFLALAFWYALFGGSGSWLDADREPNHGNLASNPPPAPAQPSPGVIHVLNDRQHQFSDSLSQP